MSEWIPDTLAGLERWMTDTGTDRQSIRRIINGLAITARDEIAQHVDRQKPTLYFPGLAARAWWDRETFPWVEPLESAAPRILREWEESGGVGPGEVQDSHRVRGRWSVRFLSCIGRPDRVSAKAFPVTLEALTPIPGATTAGMTYFSAVGGDTHILPHTGFTNAHLRCHLTLVANDRSRIRVGEEIREWQPGKVLVFDDTFEHEVWNNSEDTRVVLLFDVFHPELDPPEVDALKFVMQKFRWYFMRPYWRSIMTGLGSESGGLMERM